MKGFIIFEDFKKLINCKEILDGNYTCMISNYPNGEFSGVINRVTGATCNKDDTYDFETGALIALMKMCGFDKSYKAIEEAFKYNSYDAKKTKELEEENKELKKQKEQIITDMIFCDSRQNGKQYTFLKKLFKSIPMDKVEAAYNEAYNTELPLWQKEVLNQMYGVYKESKEKIELPRRQEMWNDILSCGDCEHSKYVEVKKEDLETFAKECNEKKIFSIIGYEFHLQEFWFADDRCIFQILRKPAGFICVKRVGFASENAIIDYLPPMRWDLFKKGRRIIRVTPDKLDEFMTKCSNELGGIMRPNLKRYKEFTHLFVMISDYHYDNKPTVHIMTPEDLVRNQHENPKKYSNKKIVDWEDVR